MAKITFSLNGESQSVDTDPRKKLLWVIREQLGLTGTKYSCGQGLCGSCTVLIDGRPTRSCVTNVEKVGGKSIITIEGLSENLDHPVQHAWLAEEVSQCGYCQPGQILTAAALLDDKPQPSDEDIDRAMGRVLCRCGTYQRIRQAIHRAAEEV